MKNSLHKKLFYRSIKRGCKELDEIIGNFAKLHLNEFTNDELVTYEKVLDMSDHDIYDALIGNVDSTCPIITRIKNFYQNDMYKKT